MWKSKAMDRIIFQAMSTGTASRLKTYRNNEMPSSVNTLVISGQIGSYKPDRLDSLSLNGDISETFYT